ncbi:hypothetical protein AVDCRST_MAG81-1250 [uncultured Synechococcales cyanobacterium]|uniref:Uncharacterized protein n=1 Tax=uncultured Synechococcales cyanobacterium TaxID=1936017 RepID=A0A6J4V5C4_9CYAN|nr:hypothetical protein AVDCRST_MAG81-1250 [uncultured Synechococcales cyanobacterium]
MVVVVELVQVSLILGVAVQVGLVRVLQSLQTQEQVPQEEP